ncbi:sugar ABC transporter substrate-binding protein [Pseudolysinimonas yzui]|uniref:Periplasmic binding protein domain-containing protein n=1 Tax=Pseudolysinimonas yzui TaxID=2708254 RepID=A0A8J3GS68_9MICO|nr:substrate-binding domain-containing protein [Pseudolysinimonas yzui]GHF22590.1 hypothetical protein GCM10011600_24650 [Pseudolysinimonas yzui]
MRSTRIGVAAVAALALFLAGCSTAEDTNDDAGGVDVEAAQAAIQPYLDAPSAFPVTEPLETLPTGKRVALLDCGSPVCGLFAAIAVAPAEALGIELVRIEAGTTADGVAAAFDSVLEGGFDGVFVPALAPSLWERPLAELSAAGIPVVTSGVTGVDTTAVAVAGASEPSTELSGRLMALWAIAQDGADTDVVFYVTPEITFLNLLGEVFTETVTEECPGCSVRVVDIPVATFGSTAPQIVVDDLLAHPNTTAAVFGAGEQAIGLPSALTTADIEVKTLFNAPDPAVLAGIQDGSYTAGFGLDLPVLTWTMVDSLARLMTDQEPAEAATNDELVRQFLTIDNLEGDVSHGWTGYPDFADRFLALWADAN